jgi:hypothetical protein
VLATGLTSTTLLDGQAVAPAQVGTGGHVRAPHFQKLLGFAPELCPPPTSKLLPAPLRSGTPSSGNLVLV